MDDWDVVEINDFKGVDGVDCGGAKEAYAVEEVADNIFLGEPAVFPVFVEGGVRQGVVDEGLLSCTVLGLNWYNQVLCTFKN